MRTRSKMLLGGLASVVVLAVAVGSADARRIELNNQFIRVTWSPLIFSGPNFAVSCPVTLEGSFHSKTISKVSGQLIGYISRAVLTKAACMGGTALILNGIDNAPGASTLPWHIRYDSFKGTLPNITGIRIQLIGASFLIEVFNVSCLYKTTAASPAYGIAETQVVAEGLKIEPLRVEEATTIPLFEGSFLCPASGSFKGNGVVTLLGNTQLILVRLVQ